MPSHWSTAWAPHAAGGGRGVVGLRACRRSRPTCRCWAACSRGSRPPSGGRRRTTWCWRGLRSTGCRRCISGARPGCACRTRSRPVPSISSGDRVDGVRSAWTGVGAERIGEISFGAMEEELWRRLAWARAAALARGRALRGDPSAVGRGRHDGLALLLRRWAGRTPRTGGRCSRRRRRRRAATGEGAGARRVGERLTDVPFTLYSDPFEPGLECLPFVACGSSDSESSVFDNALPLERTDWIRGRVSRPPPLSPGRRGPFGRRRRRPTSTT